MGLFTLVRPAESAGVDPTNPYDAGQWFDGGDEWTATLTVTVNGAKVAESTTDRAWAPDIDGHELTAAKDGIVGEYVHPYDGPTKAPVLIIGPPTQPDSTLAEHLAQNGHPTVAVEYAGEPGLPSTPENIPIEYFAKALTFLRHQDGVQSQHLVVLGEDVGSEAAQLLAVAHPDQVHGLVLTNPLARVTSADDKGKSALWTEGGTPVPFADPTGSRPSRPDHDPSVLHTEQAKAFVVTVCGSADSVGDSCAAGREIATRLRDAHYAQPVHQIQGQSIGASVVDLVPYQPHTIAWGGGNRQTESVEMPKIWAQVLHALEDNGQVT